MIPSAQEIQKAIYGAWRLFRMDPRGLACFEDSLEAFWRSFFAAVLILPGFAILVVIDLAEAEMSAGPLEILLVELIGYVAVWAGFPLALYYFCRGIDRQSRFLLAATALNWSAVIQILLILPVYLIAAGGILSPGLATLAAFVAVLVTLFYMGFIAHTALEVSPPIAAMVVAIDALISFAVQALIKGILN